MVCGFDVRLPVHGMSGSLTKKRIQMITNNKQNKKWFVILLFFLVAILATGSFSSVVFARYSNITQKISEVMKEDKASEIIPREGIPAIINDTVPKKVRSTLIPLFNGSSTLNESNRMLGKYLVDNCNFVESLADQLSLVYGVSVRFDVNGKVTSVRYGKAGIQVKQSDYMMMISKALHDAPAFKLNGNPNEIGNEANYIFRIKKGQCNVIQSTPPTVRPIPEGKKDTLIRNTIKFTPPKVRPNEVKKDTLGKIRNTIKFTPPIIRPDELRAILNDTVSERDSMTFKMVPPPPPPIVKKNSNGLIGKSIPPPPPPSPAHLLPWPLFNGSTTFVESGQLMGKYLTDNCDFSASFTDQKTSISILVRVRFDTNGKVKSVQPGNKSDVMFQSLKERNVSDKTSDFEVVSKALYAAPAFKLLRNNNKICDELNYLLIFQKSHCTVNNLTLVFHKINAKE